MIKLFSDSYNINYLLKKEQQIYEIEKQFKKSEEYREAEEHRKANLISEKNNEDGKSTQAFYLSFNSNNSEYDQNITESSNFWG